MVYFERCENSFCFVFWFAYYRNRFYFQFNNESDKILDVCKKLSMYTYQYYVIRFTVFLFIFIRIKMFRNLLSRKNTHNKFYYFIFKSLRIFYINKNNLVSINSVLFTYRICLNSDSVIALKCLVLRSYF
jgi:hypothetical protein